MMLGPGSLLDRERDRRALVQPCASGLVLESVHDRRDVAQVDRNAVAHLDGNRLQLSRILDFRWDPNEVLEPPDIDLTAGHGQVLAQHRADNVGEPELKAAEPPGIHIDVHLPLASADHVHTVDAGNCLEVVLELLGDLLELHEAHFTCEAHDEHGDLREVDVLHTRVVVYVRGQFRLGQVDPLADFLQRGVEVHIRVELDLDDR